MCKIKYNEKTNSLEIETKLKPIVQLGIEKIIDLEKGITLKLWDERQLN